MHPQDLERIIAALSTERLRAAILALAQRPEAAGRDAVGVAAIANRLAAELAQDRERATWPWEQYLRFSQALRRALAGAPGMRYVEAEP
ncbi:MAG: hypothetical protein GXY76_06665 [Chloroflexi bacterium]|nr:hypothetical protein [Chloroflexota bacterium]